VFFLGRTDVTSAEAEVILSECLNEIYNKSGDHLRPQTFQVEVGVATEISILIQFCFFDNWLRN